jgi:serine/threonine-protein kinase HipA
MIGCQVYLWGTLVGALTLMDDESTASFNYDSSFLKSQIALSPIWMPLSERIYSFPELPYASFHGLPGIFADSLPDKYGNAVIDAWCAANGRDPKSFTPIERLSYIGKRGMGALEYVPVTSGRKSQNDPLKIDELTQFAAKILNERSSWSLAKSDDQMNELFQISSSAGGARAKALIALNEATGEIRSGQAKQPAGFHYYLIKFDGLTNNRDKEGPDPLHYTLIEYVYYLLAKHCGIQMTPCQIKEENGHYHFLTKRFDRDDDGNKIMMASLAGLDHADFNNPGSYSYEQGAQVLDQLGDAIDKEEYFRRMVFNVVFSNQDDHVKNISFLMDRRGKWRLAPDYDVTFAYNPQGPYTSAHQMRIQGKRSGIALEDVVSSGKAMGLATQTVNRLIHQVLETVPLWRIEAEKVGISSTTIQEVESHFVLLK